MARALELWASSLRAVKARMAPLFTQERVAASAGLFLDGLPGGERRKTGWMRAEAASDPGPADAVISHPLVQKSRQATINHDDRQSSGDPRGDIQSSHPKKRYRRIGESCSSAWKRGRFNQPGLKSGNYRTVRKCA
jgi:hypothetical protein